LFLSADAPIIGKAGVSWSLDLHGKEDKPEDLS